MPYEEVVEGDYVWVGTPEEIAGRVAAIRDLCPGLTEVAIVANAGGADHWKAIKAQELFAEHVIPAVRDTAAPAGT